MEHVETFTKEGLEDFAAFKRDIAESIRAKEFQKEMTFRLLKKNFPQEDLSCFEELSFEQYETMADMLIGDKSLNEIKAYIEESKVIEATKHVEAFTKEGLEELAAFKRELSDSIVYSEGVYDSQKEMTLYFLETKYSGYDLSCFEDFSLAQYKTICNMLMDDKSFDEIQSVLS